MSTKSSDTTSIIIKAATEVFAEVGFAGARMDEIARRAGVNKATIYYNIGNKEALYGKVLLSTFGQRINRVEDLINQCDSPEEKLRIFIDNLTDTIDANPSIPKIIMWEHASGGKHFTEEVGEQIARMLRTLMSILESGNNQGQFIKIHPMIVQFLLIGSLIFYKTSAPIRHRFDIFPEAAKNLPENVSGQIAGELSNLIINGLKTRE